MKPGPGLRALATALGLLSAPVAFAQPTAEPIETTPARMRLNLERTELPGNEGMGLVGTSYLLEVVPGVWVGPAAYGAITGSRGGMFTVGAEAGWQRPLVGPLSIELGFYAGGGGGGNAPVGGGLMLRPHVDLLWNIGGQQIGLSWSRVRFPSGGRIDSRQLGLVWNVDTEFRRVPAARLGEVARHEARSGIGFDRVQAVAGVYRTRAGSMRVSGPPLPRNIGYAGARLEQAFDDNAYWGLEAAGAASGGVSGYAEYLGLLGTEYGVAGDWLTLGGRVAVGMGGGGDVDVGGGLLLKAGAYAIARLGVDLGVTAELGWAQAPQGSFKALYGTVALNWILDDRTGSAIPARTTRMEWVGGVERYAAARRDGTTRKLDAVSLRVNRYMSERFYLSAQAHSAYDGGAGGYSVGLLGVGWRTDIGSRWHAGVEALAGAAGGGGVDTAGGALVQPMAYIGYALTPGVALRVGGGRIQGLRGPLKGDVVEVSLAFTFGVTSRGVR
ncbi:hypothetical protein [uncultured Methylibium sp.]|uniref:hypothetical protein n=1 Tax=uncultured Methylibium sp. TaxID=381093 RepID=UPI0025F94E6B|nr:hypothetical protein [uncultured Methylibium sp.]